MGEPLTAANAHFAGVKPPDPCAELRAEVERLRLLEKMWEARLAWLDIEYGADLELWQVYDKARKAYEAWRKP